MIADTKDILLEVQAEFTEMFREVMQEAMMPQVKAMAKMKWAQMSEDEKEQFKTERPQEYRAFMEGA